MIDRYLLQSRMHVSRHYLYPSSHSGVVVLQGLAEGPEDGHGIHVPLRLDRGQGFEVEEVVGTFPDLEIDLRDDNARTGVIFLDMSVVTTTTIYFFLGRGGLLRAPSYRRADGCYNSTTTQFLYFSCICCPHPLFRARLLKNLSVLDSTSSKLSSLGNVPHVNIPLNRSRSMTVRNLMFLHEWTCSFYCLCFANIKATHDEQQQGK